LLQEPYDSFYRFDISNNEDIESSYNKWVVWRENEFDSKKLLKVSGLSEREVEEFFMWICMHATSNDPLFQYYDLLQIIKKELKIKLKGTALLVQDYYEFARMLRKFLSEIKNEVVEYPIELMNNTKGKWKEYVYKTELPLDYSNPFHQKSILDRFLNFRPNSLIIVCEGETEGIAIKSIFESMGINNKEKGLIILDAKGKGNIKNPLLLAMIAQENFMDIYIILDGEPDSQTIIQNMIDKKILQNDMYTIWEKDFEYDNFGTEKVLNEINKIFKENNKDYEITITEVNHELNNKVLMKAIKDIFYKKYNKKKLICPRD